MRLYIAGRITNEPGYLSKFAQACTEVLLLDHVPVNPCELHGDTCFHDTWEEFMVCDIKAMLDCDGVYALRNWQSSKGATIEVQLALRLGMVVLYQAPLEIALFQQPVALPVRAILPAFPSCEP